MENSGSSHNRRPLDGAGLSYEPTSEYPDPETTAPFNDYPWLGDRNEEASLHLAGAISDIDPLQYDDSSSTSSAADVLGLDLLDSDELETQAQNDPDYRESESNGSEDETLSEDELSQRSKGIDLAHKFERRSKPAKYSRSPKLVNPSKINHAGLTMHPRRFLGLGRGAKGVKRGIRKPIEPDADFTIHLSNATMSFADGDFGNAELCALKALKLNPEVFQAHNLLSEIHAAQGNFNKAIQAAWNGAHTQPRDKGMWKRVADLVLNQHGEDREDNLRDAIYCYSRIISVDSQNFEARYERAALNRELGYKKKAVSEYEYLCRLLPHNLTLLKRLADTYLEIEAPELALERYETSVIHDQSNVNQLFDQMTWSDVNIIAELYILCERYDQGLLQIKRLCRALSGRGDEVYWDRVTADDREWDLEDSPRRTEIVEFHADAYSPSSYGRGLPLELRVKLGILRLKSDLSELGEAMAHFNWLEPGADHHGAKVWEFPDLFRETSGALLGQDKFSDALIFLKSIADTSGSEDLSVLMEIATCHRRLDSLQQAEQTYERILDIKPSFTSARVALWNMKNQNRRKDDLGGSVGSSWLLPHSMSNSPRKSQGSISQGAEILSLHHQWQRLRSQRDQDTTAQKAFSQSSRLLMQTFQDARAFSSTDRHIQTDRLSNELDLPEDQQSCLGVVARNGLTVGMAGSSINLDNFQDISLTDWLDIFLEAALDSAKNGDIKTAYDCIDNAAAADVFYRDQKALMLIHICWFACALYAMDAQSLCSVARWFTTQFQFVTDTYRLFSALNGLCESRDGWYNSSPSQKYVLRQLKAMDFSLLGETRVRGHFQERASYSTRDASGVPIQAQELDTSLLMLYGHILYAGKNYAYAISYFLRALSVDTSNKSIKFSIALAYVHWALKRQADNRHHTLMQGLAFLWDYYEGCSRSNKVVDEQEAEYNTGRIYHLLGLVELAIPFYERCIALGSGLKERKASGPCHNVACEAALALQTHFAANGNFGLATQVTQQWLIL